MTEQHKSKSERVAPEDVKVPTRMQIFLRSSLFDALLCLIASVCLTLTVSFGFESASAIRGNAALVAGITVPMLAILFAGGWSKRMVFVSAALAVVYAAVVVGACGALSSAPMFADGAVNDVAENYVPFGFVALAVPLLVYLLSRRRIGVIVLFVAGVLSFELTQYLFRDWISSGPGAPIAIVGMAAIAALFIFQTYRSSLLEAHRVEKTFFSGAAGFAVLTSGIVLIVGVGLFFGVIAPLGLSTAQIKPFKDYYVRPVVYYSGVYMQQEIDNPDVVTSKLNDQNNDSNQDAQGGSKRQSPQSNNDVGSNPLSDMIQTLSNFDKDDWNAMFDAINFKQAALWGVLSLLLLAALVIAAILAQRRRRARRLKRIADESLAYRVCYLFDFLMQRFSRLGIVRPDSLTPLEFAMASRAVMAPYSQDTGGVDFLEATLCYQRATYGEDRVTAEDYDKVERFYNAFFHNAYQQLGARRWVYKFWRL